MAITDARIFMPAALLLAAAFAVGHDRFYASLNGQDTSMVSQRTANVVGTALAFLVKSSLGIAATAAFTQLLWRTLLRSTLPVKTIDSLSSMTTNILHILDIRLWRFPVLLILALVSWAIAIATVFPPGALSTTIANRPQTVTTSIALMNWSNMSFVNDRDTYERSEEEIWISPKVVLTTLADQIGKTGELPQLPSAQNSSYTVSIIAPSLTCDTQVWTGPVTCSSGLHLDYLDYSSWYGDSSPISSGKNLSVPCTTDNGTGSHSTPEYEIMSVPSLYVVSRAWNDELHLTTCSLQNSTFTLQFDYHHNQSVVVSKLVQPLQPELLAKQFAVNHDTAEGRHDNQLMSFYAIVMAFGNLLYGQFAPGFMGMTILPVFSTRLAYSDELAAATESAFVSDDHRQGGLFDANATRRGPLAPMIEELFQNITIGSLTSPMIVGQQEIEMQVDVSVSLYVYTQWHLWLPYGLIIGVVAASTLLASVVSRASYSTKFSTFLRTAKLNDSGEDPLPKEIGNMEMSLGEQKYRKLKNRDESEN